MSAKIFINAVTFLVLPFAVLQAHAADVPHDSSFKLKSTPEVWSTGSQICFAQNGKDECARVTHMGEIKLRDEGQTSADVVTTYTRNLTAEQQKALLSYNKFFVRYLALDGDTEGRYIVQVFFSVLTGTQAVYIYGNYKFNDQKLQVEPTGYAEAGGWNMSFLRSNDDDQTAIGIAQRVIDIWAASSSASLDTKP